MGFRLKINGTIALGIEAIRTVDFSVDTPKDSNAKSTDTGATLTVSGKILTILDDGTEGTVDLAKWAMVPAEKADCYREAIVEVVAAGQVVREYTLPNAFIVDYTENYGDTEGVGTFKLVMKQKKDKLIKVVVNGGYGE